MELHSEKRVCVYIYSLYEDQTRLAKVCKAYLNYLRIKKKKENL